MPEPKKRMPERTRGFRDRLRAVTRRQQRALKGVPVPADVARRAAKTGATRCDWYAGRRPAAGREADR